MKKTIYVLKTLWSEVKEWWSECWDMICVFSGMIVLPIIPILPQPIPMYFLLTIICLVALAMIALVSAGIICFCLWLKDKIKRILRVYDEQKGGK